MAKKIKQKDKNTGGKIDTAGPDNSAVSNHKSDDENAFEDGKRIYFNQTLGQQKPKDEPPYAEPPDATEEQAKKLQDVRDKFAPNADKPTTAAGKNGEKDLPKILKEVDPQQKAQVLPQLYQQLQQMQSILSMGSGMGGGGGGGGGQGGQGGQGAPSFLPSGVSFVLEDSFTGALCILVRKFGFESVIEVMLKALENNQIADINIIYRKIVKNSVANLIKLALYFGPLDIPVSQYDETIYGDIVPSPLVERANVPDGFFQTYYLNFEDDPYPGYIEWTSPDRDMKKTVYTKREPKSFVFKSASEEIYSTSEKEIAADLEPYFEKVGEGSSRTYVLILTGKLLNAILIKQSYNIEENTNNTSMGNNGNNNMNSPAGGGGGGNMLGGMLQQLMQMFKSDQLPKSVLNQGNIQETLQKYKKDMGYNNQLFELAKQALGGGDGMGNMLGGNMGGMGGLQGMFGGIQGIMGGFGSGGGGAGGAMGGNFGTGGGFGGGSSGGGGGAGSGFPTASFGQYNGGGISPRGMQNIEGMLTLLQTDANPDQDLSDLADELGIST